MRKKTRKKHSSPHIRVDWAVIREGAVAGVPVKELAKRYGVTIDAIYQRICKEDWATPHRVNKRAEERTQQEAQAKAQQTATSCQDQAHTQQPEPHIGTEGRKQEQLEPHTQAEAVAIVAEVSEGRDSLETMRQVEQSFGVSDGSGGGAILAEKGRIWDENSLIIAKAAEKTTSTLKDLPLPGVENLGDVLKLLTILHKSTGQDKPTPPVQVNLWSAGSGL